MALLGRLRDVAAALARDGVRQLHVRLTDTSQRGEGVNNEVTPEILVLVERVEWAQSELQEAIQQLLSPVREICPMTKKYATAWYFMFTHLI